MKKTISILILSLFTITSLYGEETSAEALVASKTRADISYKQLMELMGEASSMMHKGLIRENKQMVKDAANIILNHPAPKHKPWSIMAKSNQNDFKQTLLSYDKILDTDASLVAQEAQKENWFKANEAFHQLNNSCISCHAVWKQKVIK